MQDDARTALGQLAAMTSQWGTSDAAFPERGPTNAISMRLITDLHRTIARWAEWAGGSIDRIEQGEDSAMRLADEVFSDIARDDRLPSVDRRAEPARPASRTMQTLAIDNEA
jgi:hypothetical protein